MMEPNDSVDHTPGDTEGKEFETAETEESTAEKDTNNRVWFWVVAALLFGGFIGWVIGRQSGLAQDEFDACLDSGRYYDAVNAELAEGTELGVRGTPAFFINGQSLSGAQPFPVFEQIFEQILAES